MNCYNRQSPGAAWLDYTSHGAYFITICTCRGAHYLGMIINGEIYLSLCKMLADDCWKNIPNQFHGVELGAFVVMPNHIYGILILPKISSAGMLLNNYVPAK